jgi:hypothetical protein
MCSWGRRSKGADRLGWRAHITKLIRLRFRPAQPSQLPLPSPVSHAKSIAETILRSAQEGERDPGALERMAFLELMISPRDGSWLSPQSGRLKFLVGSRGLERGRRDVWTAS